MAENLEMLRRDGTMSRVGKCANCGKELKSGEEKKMIDFQETDCMGNPKPFKLCQSCYDFLLEEQYIEA
jgi:uncharacterized protein with PIN domain